MISKIIAENTNRCLLLCSVFILLFPFVLLGKDFTITDIFSLIEQHPAIKKLELEREKINCERLDIGKREADKLLFEVENFGGDFPGVSQSELSLSLQRPLINRARVVIDRKKNDHKLLENKVATEQLKREIYNNVCKTFHRTLIAKMHLENAIEAKEISASFLETAKWKVEAGSIPESEIHKAEMELAKAQSEVKQRESELQRYKIELSRQLGLSETIKGNPIGSLTSKILIPSIEMLKEALHNNHPDLLALSLSSKANLIEIENLKASLKPEYAISIGARNFRDEKKTTCLLALEVVFPNVFKTSGLKKSLMLENERIEIERKQKISELELELEEMLVRLKSSKIAAEEFESRLIPISVQLLETAIESYRSGKTNYLTVLEARKALLDNRTAFINFIEEMYSAATDIEKLCGVCLISEKH